MIEKVLASSAAVLVWFGLYKFMYKQSFSPGLPGEGVFKYVVWRDPAAHLARRQNCVRQKQADNKWSSKDDVPKFMGMPLYGLNMKEYKEEKLKEDLTEEEVFYLNGMGGKRPSLSSMSNMDRLRGTRSSLADIRTSGLRARSRSHSRT